MAKDKTGFICTTCGEPYVKWQGKCTGCGQWNSIIHQTSPRKHAHEKAVTKLIPLDSIQYETADRLVTNINEFNIVCGGGMVTGSVILIGGEPGIGKSTLALQIASAFRTIYISGEESPEQIKRRSDRLRVSDRTIHLSTDTDADVISQIIRDEKPECIIVDSIQTLYVKDSGGAKGSVHQIRECASRIFDAAKVSGTIAIMIGHITKDGTIAGPKMLEHLVDTVLYFEGNINRDLRILRSFKNRYGSVNEVGLFSMTEKGLCEVKDKSRVFFNPYTSLKPGNAVSGALEGSRIILFEVQSLVVLNNGTIPRRMSDGFDINRLIILTAVLEKHTGLNLALFDVFINVSGGFQISETSADLAVAVSIISSFKNMAIPENMAFIGEISLSGEIRPVNQCMRRIMELKYGGFLKIIIPQSQKNESESLDFNGEIIGISTIQEIIDILFA